MAAAAARRHVLDDAARGVMQPAMGDRPRGEPGEVSWRGTAGLTTLRGDHDTSKVPSTSTAASAGSTATPDGGAGVPTLVAEHRDHEVGGAVHHLRPVEEVRLRIDEAAEPHHADDLVEIAERGLELREQIDRAGARGGLALLDGDAGAELALGDQVAVLRGRVGPDTNSRRPERTKPT